MTIDFKHSLENLKTAFETTFLGLMEEKYRPWLHDSPFFLSNHP